MSDAGTDRIDARLSHLEEAVDQINKRLGRVETQLDEINGRVDDMNRRMDDRFNAPRTDMRRWLYLFCSPSASSLPSSPSSFNS